MIWNEGNEVHLGIGRASEDCPTGVCLLSFLDKERCKFNVSRSILPVGVVVVS